MFLSNLGYSELIQRLFEKMAFFLWTPYIKSSKKQIAFRQELGVSGFQNAWDKDGTYE